MKYLAILLAVLIIMPTVSFAEDVVLQGFNEMRWAEGQEEKSTGKRTKRYFENRLNLDMYYGNLRFGTRYTVLQPSEWSQDVKKTGTESFEKRFLEYTANDGDINVRVGDFYTVWGRGLTLALLEDIQQGFDAGLDGIHTSLRYERFELQALAGQSKVGTDTTLVREAQVSAGHVAVELPLNLTLAGQAMLVQPKDANPASYADTYEESKTWGGYLAYNGSLITTHFEHALENVSINDSYNHATYASVTSAFGNIGIALDYKNYNYHMYANANSSEGAALPFHNAPIVQRAFTSNLFGKKPHEVHFYDEVGFQAELTWSPSFGTIIASYAQSSSHGEDDNIVPTVKEEDSPYREVFVEYQAYPSDAMYLTSWTGVGEELKYNNARSSWLQRAVFGSKIEYTLSYDWSCALYAEGLFSNDITNPDNEKDWTEALITTGITYKNNYTLTVNLEMTGQDNPPEGNSEWFNVAARAMIAGKHELMVTVGKERGGLVCSSGKCRQVDPFNGVRVSLVSMF